MSDPTPPPAPQRITRPLAPTADENASVLIARVHPALLAIGSLLVVCAMFGGFAVYVLSTAQAQTTSQLAPVKTEVDILKAQQMFMLVEQREGRVDMRALAELLKTGTAPAILARPMAPLPVSDAGRIMDGGP